MAKEQLNRSYVYHPSNMLNKSQVADANDMKLTDQNKRNSALTILHQDEDFHSLTESFDKKL